MKIKKVALIINPAAGQDYPILAVANRFFQKHAIEWIPYITQKADDATVFTKKALKEKVDVILVYGGDGTVMEVSKVMVGQKIPLLILAGGTANVLAREMNLPVLIPDALELLRESKHQVEIIDTYTVNKVPYMLRMNIDVFARMIQKAPRESKDSFGRVAYMISGIQALKKTRNHHYKLWLDNHERLDVEGVGMMITNVGSVGVQDFRLHPSIQVRDGKLDILILPEASIASLATLASEVAIKKFPQTFQHLTAKKIIIELDHEQEIIIDDEPVTGKVFRLEVVPRSLSLLVRKK